MTKPTSRHLQVLPECPPGLSAKLQESWASWWNHSPLASQLGARDVLELKRLWLLYAEEELLDTVLLKELALRRLTLPGSERLRVELIALVQRWGDVYEEMVVLEELFLTNHRPQPADVV